MKTYEERTADVMDKVAHKKKVHKQVAAITSCASVCVVVLVLSLVLFLPYSTPGGNSPYQNVINVLSPVVTPYRNNFEKWTSGINLDSAIGLPKGAAVYDRGDLVMEDATAAMPNSGTGAASDKTNEGEQYQENTNNQVEGVREGDLLKQSTNYFYYLRVVPTSEEGYAPYYYEDFGVISYRKAVWGYYYQYKLQLDVYRKDGLNTALVTSFDFAPAKGNLSGFCTKEMYLNDACDTITVVADGLDSDNGVEYTVAFALDIADLQSISVKAEQYVTGEYVSSRISDGRLLIITEYHPWDFEYEKPETFIPYVTTAGGKADLVDPEDIVLPDQVERAYYTVVTLFDSNLASRDKVAFLGYSSNVYATGDHLYVSHANGVDRWEDSENKGDKDETRDTTTLYCVSYGADGLRTLTHLEVPGTILNQYSMDEYDGVLRVAATIRTYCRQQYSWGSGYWWNTDKMNAGLYCYDTDTWQLIAKEEFFAPEDETVRSARFMGNFAYICTAVQTRDPVFCFDLSDYDNITYTHTGEITGFSMSLTPFVEDSLVGVGVDEDWYLKVELYRKGEDSVTSIAKMALDRVNVEEEFKTYLFNSQYALVGVPGYRYTYYDYRWDEENDTWVDEVIDEGGQYYYLFQYKDGALSLYDTIDLSGENNSRINSSYYLQNVRAAVSDGYCYVFLEDMCKVVALS